MWHGGDGEVAWAQESREEGKKEAGEDPHHHVKLQGYWFDGGERWSGGAASGRGTASMAAAARASGAESGGCSLGGKRAMAWCLNRGGQVPRRAGPRPRAVRNGAVRRPDSDSSPSWARGGRRP
jgi:hypothetical protein